MKTILLLFLVTIVNNLHAQQCYEANNRTKFNFKLLKKGIHIDTSMIKIDGVYLNKHENQLNGKLTFEYIRFFENGRVYYSSTYCSFPSIKELNELNYGSYGYYRIDSNKLTIENHSGPASYYYTYYKIDSVIINRFAFKRRGWNFPKHKVLPELSLVYTFYPIMLKKQDTFW